MLKWIRRKLSRRSRSAHAPARSVREAGDRSSGEEAQSARDVLAEETSAPGTPRLKSKNL